MKSTPRHEPESEPGPEHTDHRVPAGCPTCGGDLWVRVSAAGARGFCGRCAALTRPMMIAGAAGWHLHHRAPSA